MEESYLFSAFSGARAAWPANLTVMAPNAAMPAAMMMAVMA